MTWERTSKRWPWRDFLTAEEAETVRAHDEQIAAIEAMRAKVIDIRLIQNRAIQRAKYNASRKANGR